MFSQELLTNGELNHFSLKERMVEIGKRWHKLSQGQKDKYKKQVEEQQLEYKAELEAWVKVRTKGCLTITIRSPFPVPDVRDHVFCLAFSLSLSLLRSEPFTKSSHPQ